MLGKLEALFAALNQRGVRYCQWKKNVWLDRKLRAQGDLDLLLDEGQRSTFEEIVDGLGFRRAARIGATEQAPAHHFFGLDECSGALIHLDVYERLLAGGSLLQNYDLPLVPMLFTNLEWRGLVPAPSRGAELLLFTLRRLLACASPLEHLLLYRDYEATASEIEWLASAEAQGEAEALLATYLPEVAPVLLRGGIRALRRRSAVVERWRIGRQLARSLAAYRMQPLLIGAAARGIAIAGALWRRLLGRRRRLGLVPRGAVIAVIGPDASGKSTTVRELGAWFGTELAVLTSHAGKPPTSALTILPRTAARLVRAARHLLPASRREAATDPPTRVDGAPRTGLRLYGSALRSLLLAVDRWRLLNRAAGLAAAGAIVVLDRYPTAEPGGVLDSAQLDPEALAVSANPAASLLARLEHRIYQRMPPPDNVVRLRLSLAAALERNAARTEGGGPEPVEYITERFGRLEAVRFPHSRLLDVEAGGTFSEVLHEVKRQIWAGLTPKPGKE